MAFPIRLRPAVLFPALLCAGAAAASAAPAPIDREALVARHAVRVDHVDPENALSVGNGDFAFNVDVTGLQSFGELYHDKGVPLETRATWAWHSFPNPAGLRLEDAMKPYPFHGRTIQYAALQDSPAGAYFRENPHPLPLGEISLLYQGRVLAPADLSDIGQTLDLWTGVVRSTYTPRRPAGRGRDGRPSRAQPRGDPDRFPAHPEPARSRSASIFRTRIGSA